jgi:predicted AlkP superfamily pyrophosphatase or phosphodiesterase
VLLLDALGWRFVERYADHPLLRRFARDGTVTPVTSQFPSTTTAHVTTMHTGLPVGLHGLYEWHVLEPAWDRIVTPLRSALGQEGGDSIVAAGLDPAVLVPPGPGLYDRLVAAGVQVRVHQPDRFSPSTFDRVVAPAATFVPFGELDDGLRAAVGGLAGADRAYAYVYFDLIDTQGHLTGPASPEFDARAVQTLDAVGRTLFGPGAPPVPADTWLLLTADHGQLDVDPTSVLWLDDVHPPLRDLALGPAGSARDVFLHVPDADVAATVAALAGRLGDAAEVLAVADLLAAGAFGPEVGPRLLERLATVAVLPAPGRLAWLRSHGDRQATFRGHHGGRTPEETGTHLSVLQLG